MSLRARLLLGTGLVALVLVVAAVIITRTTERHLFDQVDDRLAATPIRGEVEDLRPRPALGPGERNYSELFVAVVDRDGTVGVMLTPDLQTDVPTPELPVERIRHSVGTDYFTVGSTGDVRYRVRTVGLGPRAPILVTALPIDDVDATIERLVRVEVVATLLALAALGLVTFWVLRLGVQPIKQMTATATAIAAGDLSHRVPDVAPGTEAGELGSALNRMLHHIESAFDERDRTEEQLRRLVADASHELRTPVTTVRGYAELYRSGGLDDPSELREAMRRTEQESVRMAALIDDLLLLARLDQGRPLERGVVDLRVLAEDAARDAAAVDPDRPVTAEVDGSVLVDGDDSRLRQVVANLVGNALVHTPPSTAVAIRARREGDMAVLEVHDAGPGMPSEVAEHAFERFYRADPARSRHRGGSGLGLSIAKAIAEAHGGSLVLATGPGAGTTVRLELPAAGTAAGPAAADGAG